MCSLSQRMLKDHLVHRSHFAGKDDDLCRATQLKVVTETRALSLASQPSVSHVPQLFFYEKL